MACETFLDTVPGGTHIEYRLRVGGVSAITYSAPSGETKNCLLRRVHLTENDLKETLLHMCRGSLYAYDEPIRRGYLTPSAFPGVRIGIAGRALCDNGRVKRLQSISSLCIRLPHPYALDADEVLPALLFGETAAASQKGNEAKEEHPVHRVQATLFYAPPGVGKTTLLRAIVKLLADANGEHHMRVCVIDTSEELSMPEDTLLTADIFSGYPRGVGLSLAARVFFPEVMICDEIGDESDAKELLAAQGMGVPIIATAHAATLDELLCRPAFATLHRHRVFHRYVGLSRYEKRFFFSVTEAKDVKERNG